MSLISRRGLVKGIVAGAIVLGFDPRSRSWVTEARATTDFDDLPPLDGTLTTDPSACLTYADDFGHIVHRAPVAVLFPGSVGDVRKMVKFARQHCLQIASRGRGHTTFGQSQVDAGVVIDMSTLDEIHNIAPHHAIVDAGVLWRDLLLATTAVGLTPPVLTGFTRLTVGGTLSVGGVGGRSYRHGAQVDNVLELKVVTGEGEVETCSPTENPKLFKAALAGLGLCAIIVRAKIRLIPAKEVARTHRCVYADVPSMLADLRMLVEEERFDHVFGQGLPSPSGWVWIIEGTSFFTPGNESNAGDPHALPLPDDPFEGLACIPGTEQIEEQSYYDHTDAIGRLLDLLDMLGLGGLPHPWLDVFVPDSEIDDFAVQTIASIDPAQQIPGSTVLFIPFVNSKLDRPLLRTPAEPIFFLFDILRTAPPDPAVVNALLQHNRLIFEANRALGGKHYTISAVELSHEDWKQHFQPHWDLLKSAKHKFDPDNVLGPGPGVFP